MSFPLLLLSPSGIVYEGNVSVVYVPTAVGPVGILRGHTPLIDRINEKGGIIHFEDEGGKTHYCAVKDGAVKVSKEKVLVLSTFAVEAPTEEKAKDALAAFSLAHGEKIEENDVKLAQGLSSKKI